MGNNAVKTIVLLMALIVLSVLVGAQVSDGLKESFGAFAVIGAVAGFFLLLLMGKNAWQLVFLLGPFLAFVPLKLLSGALGVYTISIALLVFTLVQSIFLRQQKITWNGLAPFDIMYAIVILYTCFSYYRFPVLLEAFGDDVEYVGAEPYVHCFASVFYYLLLSCLSINSEELETLLKRLFWLSVAVGSVNVVYRYATGDMFWGGVGAEDSNGAGDFGVKRVTLFVSLSGLVLAYIYASAPLFSLLTSPSRMFFALSSMYGLALSGSRGILVGHFLNLFGIALLKREIGMIAAMALCAWGGLVALGSNGALNQMPYMLQRAVSILPGVTVSNEVAREAGSSSDVRVIAWKMAFDTRAGYIHDYIWGDGFQKSRAEFERSQVARMRGTTKHIGMEEGNDTLARTGNWHNGFISTMHRMGLVGCAVFYAMMFLCLTLYVMLGNYYRGKPFFAYFCALYCYVFTMPFAYSYNAGYPTSFYDFFKSYVVIKLLYSLLRKDGKIKPMVLRRAYVPMLMQELSSAQEPVGEGRSAAV